MVSQTFSTFSLEEKEVGSGHYRGKGCFCSYAKGFIYVLLAIVLALGVGLIVHFFDPTKEGCNVTDSDVSPTVKPEPELEINYRLPKDLMPSHYKLSIRPDIYGGDPSKFGFSGSVIISFECKKTTNKIILHTRKLTLDEDSIKVSRAEGEGDNYEVGKLPEWDSVREFTTIPLKRDLLAGNMYKISMEFSGGIYSDLRGIYYSSYDIEGTDTPRYILASQLQPTDARKVFPCFDEPLFKAVFEVSIDYKPPFHAMANGILESNDTLLDGWMVDHFTPTPKMSTYLLAFLVSDLDCVNSYTTKDQLVQICGRPDAIKANEADLANSVAANIQEWFEEYHDVEYPLNKTVHAAVPDFAAGAMENWGLILYRDYSLLFNDELSTTSQEQRIVVVVAHELAHMWFGNLVSMDWWDDVWLNEGFASYMETLGTNSVKPDYYMENDLVVDKVQGVMVQDSLASSHPVFQETKTPEQITALFDSITYDKGASLIRMMKTFLGEDIFRWGVSDYLKDRAYNTATNADLFEFLTKEAKEKGKDIDLAGIMNTWIKQLGYPVVTFDFDKTSNTIKLSQEHFLLDPSSVDHRPESEFNYVWKVPISYVTDSDKDYENDEHYKHWLNEETGQVTGVKTDSNWIIGNVMERFYYRVNYNQENWDALVGVLDTNHEDIEVKNRAQLVDDSFNLGRAGIVNQTLFFDITQYLSDEEEYTPWWSASRGFSYINKMYSVTGEYGNFKNYMQNQFTPQYNRLGWEESNSNHTEILMRSLVVQYACSFGVEDCVTKATDKFNQWMETPEVNSIPPNLRYAVYCTAIANGDEDEWDFAFKQFQETTSGSESKTLMQAMACTKQEWLLRRYLEMAFEEKEIRRQDFSTVFISISGNSFGRMLAWEFMINFWDVLYGRLAGSISFDRVVKAPASGFSTEYHYNMVRVFKESRNDLGALENTFNQVLDEIAVNIEWRERNQADVTQWLKNYLN